MAELLGGSGPCRPPAMSDVARLAGVSHQTVSRVINNHAAVRPETRDRVLAAIAQLGYRPNRAARALVTHRSGMIGVISVASELYGPTATLVALEQAARQHGYYVSVATLREVTEAELTAATEHLLAHRVEGVVVIAPIAGVAEVLNPLVGEVPLVMIAAEAPDDRSYQIISVNQRAGAREATEHLLELGHRAVAHVAGPQHWLDARARVAGWRDALDAAGAPGQLIEADWDAATGFRVGQELVAAGGIPTAIFAANDQLAMGLLRAFHEAGVVVGRDVSVVGFDDFNGAAQLIPPLTTVRQDFTALGQRTVEMLLAAIGGTAVQVAPVAPQLQVRASTGPA